LILKNWRPMCAESHQDVLEVFPKEGLHDLRGKKICAQRVAWKLFRQFKEIRAKIFCTPRFCLLLHRTVARKSSKRGLYICAEGIDVCAGRAWHQNLTKIPLIYNISYFKLGGLELRLGRISAPNPPWRRDCSYTYARKEIGPVCYTGLYAWAFDMFGYQYQISNIQQAHQGRASNRSFLISWRWKPSYAVLIWEKTRFSCAVRHALSANCD